MKGYFSFVIVILIIFGLVLLYSRIYEARTQYSIYSKDFYTTLDIGRSIEESAKEGAILGALFYLSSLPEGEAININEMNEIASSFSLVFVEELEREKFENYDVFCISNGFEEEEIEKQMIEDGLLEIPKEGKHFNHENCKNAIKVQVAPDPETRNIKTIKIIMSNPGMENGIIAFSYFDKGNGIAQVEILRHREIEFVPEIPIDANETINYIISKYELKNNTGFR